MIRVFYFQGFVAANHFEKIFPASEDQVLIASQLSQFRSGLGIFGRPVEKAAANSLPTYQWWLNFGASVLELQSFAVKVLSQTASSSEAERNLSLFDFMQSKRRCGLKCETLDKIVYIHANARLIDGVNEVDYEEQNVDWQLTGSDAGDSDGDSSSSDTEVEFGSESD